MFFFVETRETIQQLTRRLTVSLNTVVQCASRL